GLPALRALALPGVAAGAGALSVLSSVVPGSPGGGWSWCRLAAVSVCCPVLPEAVVGASRATMGRLASTQGCHRCPCPSRWSRPLVRRAWWAVAAPPACPPAHRGGTGPGNKSNAPPQPSPKKENTGEACGDTLPPLPCGCRCCCRCLRSACCCVAAACR